MAEKVMSFVPWLVPEPGETLTVDFPVYRRWWQFWRPRVVGTNPVTLAATVDRLWRFT
jgi:hypothetical protein